MHTRQSALCGLTAGMRDRSLPLKNENEKENPSINIL